MKNFLCHNFTASFTKTYFIGTFYRTTLLSIRSTAGIYGVVVNLLNYDDIAIDCFVWFVWFYGISTFVGYLTPNPFLCK